MRQYEAGIVGRFAEYADALQIGEGVRMEKKEPYLLSEKNCSLLTGDCGMQYYFSLYNEAVADFYRDLGINCENDFRYAGTDARYILSNLLGAGYLLSENCAYRQYGYEPEEIWEGQGVLLRNCREPMTAYTYEKYLTREDWLSLSFAERQYALLQAAVIDGGDTLPKEMPERCETAGLDRNALWLSYRMESGGEGVICGGNAWTVTDCRNGVRIMFEQDTDAELYVVFTGLRYQGDASVCSMVISADENHQSQLTYLDETNPIYTGKHDFVCNVGYLESGAQCLAVAFDREGIYTYDSLSIVACPLGEVDGYLDALCVEKPEELHFAANRIQVGITVMGNRILCLPVSYSDGWKACVDGEETQVLRVNDMMIGIALSEGEHRVELRYRTPGLAEGCALAAVGALCIFGIALYQRRRGRKRCADSCRTHGLPE